MAFFEIFIYRLRKYELLQDDTVKQNGQTLYRIRALKDFGPVKTGDSPPSATSLIKAIAGFMAMQGYVTKHVSMMMPLLEAMP